MSLQTRVGRADALDRLSDPDKYVSEIVLSLIIPSLTLLKT